MASQGVDERVVVIVVDFQDGNGGGEVVGAVRASNGCEGVFSSG